MRNPILISIAAGLLAGLAYASASPALVLVTGLIGGLPLFIVGLIWSWAAALLAGAVGSLFVHHFGSGTAGPIFAVAVVLPAVLFTLLAGLRAAVVDSSGQAKIHWMPPGAIVVIAALLSSALAAVLIANTYESIIPEFRAKLIEFLQKPPAAGSPAPGAAAGLPQDQIEKLADIFVAMVPWVIGASAMATWLLNLWLSGRIVQAMGRLRRPWPDLAAMRFPAGTPILLAASTLAASLMTGPSGFAASGVAGAFFFAYMLLGLAVIHFITRGKPWRGIALGLLYVGLAFASVWVALPIVLLGLFETIFALRRKSTGNGDVT